MEARTCAGSGCSIDHAIEHDRRIYRKSYSRKEYLLESFQCADSFYCWVHTFDSHDEQEIQIEYSSPWRPASLNRFLPKSICLVLSSCIWYLKHSHAYKNLSLFSSILRLHWHGRYVYRRKNIRFTVFLCYASMVFFGNWIKLNTACQTFVCAPVSA